MNLEDYDFEIEGDLVISYRDKIIFVCEISYFIGQCGAIILGEVSLYTSNKKHLEYIHNVLVNEVPRALEVNKIITSDVVGGNWYKFCMNNGWEYGTPVKNQNSGNKICIFEYTKKDRNKYD